MVKANEKIFLSADGQVVNDLQEQKPSQNFAFSIDGKEQKLSSIDIINKSVKELKEIGFKEMFDVNFKKNPKTGGMEPVLSPQERHDMD